MKALYFNMAGRPFRLWVDEEDLPERCELFDIETDTFIERHDLELDVCDSFDSIPITEEEFWQLVEKLRQENSSRG